ncbi:Ead domain protein [Klebsiella pneumoniae]|uniref:ead/Ea22-like family protein n=1 Tax=Klebsiella pneumoniae TaxID=573 RepID=UPI000E2B1AED|nr:ead/Ea22-like family protein [Klebsiella pneumoniae]SWB09652.1 Ead domain protein [Klebsiella pneumoniae]
MTDITELAQRMKAAAEKATPGEWWADEVKNEGCYGSGDDCVEGFTSYAIYGSDGQTLFDSLNSDAACICEEYDGEGHVAWDETAQRNAEFIALANPANILALVEALEKAQAAERRWHRVASRVHEQACESDVKIDELEAIRAAAEKLVRCKGRYHSEQNYRALAALFGVNTPDLPPLDSESSAVTVKLTDINDYLAEVHDKTLNQAFRLLAEGVRAGDVAAMRAAGIKVEAE